MKKSILQRLSVAALLGGIALLGACAEGPTEPVDSVAFHISNGNDGCTPGFWKTRPHQDDWPPTGLSQGNSYDAVFGVNNLIGPSLTLLQGVRKNGNSYNSFVRHSVAALLNASHPDVAYGLSPAGVIAIVQAAHASGDFDAAKDQFQSLNERLCPIG